MEYFDMKKGYYQRRVNRTPHFDSKTVIYKKNQVKIDSLLHGMHWYMHSVVEIYHFILDGLQ